MRDGIMIRDTEYRDALEHKMSLYDNDIFVNIITNPAINIGMNSIPRNIQPFLYSNVPAGTNKSNATTIKPSRNLLIACINSLPDMIPYLRRVLLFLF